MGPPPAWLFSHNTGRSSDTTIPLDDKMGKKEAKPEGKTPSEPSQPPQKLLDLVDRFLSEYFPGNAHSAFTKQRAKKGWAMTTASLKSEGTTLLSVFQAWEAGRGDVEGGTKKTKASAPRATKNLKRKTPPSSSSESSSDGSSSENSDSDSDDDDDDDDDAKSKPQSKKQKTQSDSDSSSDSSSDSDPSSESGSESDLSSESSSSSSSSESEDESSDSDSDKAAKSKASSSPSSSSSSSSDSDSSDDEDTDMKDTKPANKAKDSDSSETLDTTSSSDANPKKKQNEPFSRIPKDIKVDPKFASNAYVPVSYSLRAHEDLIVTKGKGFTKEKNKKKKGSFRGGAIDIHEKKSIYFDD